MGMEGDLSDQRLVVCILELKMKRINGVRHTKTCRRCQASDNNRENRGGVKVVDANRIN